jgi:hypothetical protein
MLIRYLLYCVAGLSVKVNALRELQLASRDGLIFQQNPDYGEKAE